MMTAMTMTTTMMRAVHRVVEEGSILHNQNGSLLGSIGHYWAQLGGGCGGVCRVCAIGDRVVENVIQCD